MRSLSQLGELGSVGHIQSDIEAALRDRHDARVHESARYVHVASTAPSPSACSQAGLLSEIDRLGTNLLTVTNGQTLFGDTAELPAAAPAMIRRVAAVKEVAASGAVSATPYRNSLIPSGQTGGLRVLAVTLDLPRVVGASIANGAMLNAATAGEPVVVLGAAAAAHLGIDRVFTGERIWIGSRWFYVAGS